MPEEADLANGIHNGAVMAAAFLARAVNEDWQNTLRWAEGHSDGQYLFWRALFADPNSDGEKIGLMSEKCGYLLPLQQEIVDELRDVLAGFK
jgi:hypothetical protein